MKNPMLVPEFRQSEAILHGKCREQPMLFAESRLPQHNPNLFEHLLSLLASLESGLLRPLFDDVARGEVDGPALPALRPTSTLPMFHLIERSIQ